MDKGKVQDFKFYSNELQEELEILVYLPPQYTPFSQYSYMIAQDGKDYFMLGRIPRLLDKLITENEIEPIIFFGIPYKDVQDRRKKYHPNGEKHQQYMNFLIHEFIPFIEENYPVSQMGKSRALAGDSLAATVSLLSAQQYPNMFGKLMLHSPYVNQDILQSSLEFNHWDLLTIYHVVGLLETEVKMTDGAIGDFLTPNRKLMQIIKENNTEYFYDEFNGNHTWTYWQKDLLRGLKFLFPY